MLFRFVSLVLGGFFLFLDNVDKGRTDDTRGNGNHGNADEADDATEQFAKRRNGVNVAVAHRRKGHDGPPKAVAHIFEHVGLCVALNVVHQYGRKAHHDEAGGVGRGEFVANRRQGTPNELKRLGVANELENDENVGQNNDVNRRRVPVKVRKYAGKYGYKVDKAVERKQILQPGLALAQGGVKRRGGKMRAANSSKNTNDDM